MGRFDKRFSVTGRRNQVSDFFLNCFLGNISRYPTIIFFILPDCFKFYKTQFESANPKPFLIMVLAFKCLVREESGYESRALPRRIYKIISIKRIPLQQFLFSDDDNLYDDLYFDYNLQIQ